MTRSDPSAGERDHARARELAAARPDGFLSSAESTWLDEHLAGCDACRDVAAAFDAQRSLFAPARSASPVAPRDLWARTAAALESEASRRGRRRRRPWPSLAYAPLVGALVIAVAVGAGLLNGDLGKNTTKGEEAEATPFPLVAADFDVLTRNDEGDLELHRQRISEVCPPDAESCSLTLAPQKIGMQLPSGARSWDAFISPDQEQVVVVQRGTDGTGVFVLNVPEAQPGPTDPPAPTASLAATATPTPTPTAAVATASATTLASASPASPSPSTGASESVAPSPSESASADPSVRPSVAASTAPTDAPSPSSSDAASPSASPPSPSPEAASPTPTTTPTIAPTPSIAVTPLPDGTVEIARDVVLTGNAASYSPDGTRFAFSARPSNGSAGPDVYVWRVGTPRAVAVTTDHASLFAGWIADRVLVSRVTNGRARTDIVALDTLQVVKAAGETMWRPTIGPADGTAVWWDGAVKPATDGFGWLPANGRLVLGGWPADGKGNLQELAGRGTTDWQVQWDASGTYLAVWTTTAAPGEAGTLSLYRIDPATGRADLAAPKLAATPAYEGFSLRGSRLTWSAPAAGGDRTVQVLAWKGDTFGRIEILTDDGTTVVR